MEMLKMTLGGVVGGSGKDVDCRGLSSGRAVDNSGGVVGVRGT